MNSPDDRLITGGAADEDVTLDTTLRPPSLAEYIDFSNGAPAEYIDTKPAVDAAAPKPSGDGVLPRKGMTRGEAERAFGKPVIDAVDRREGSVVVTTLVFVSGDQKITADFIEDVLVRYTITSR